MIGQSTRKANREYWDGYRHAKRRTFECGIQGAREEYAFGLNGKSPAYYRGFLRYMMDTTRKDVR